jgi:hypothetical protein
MKTRVTPVLLAAAALSGCAGGVDNTLFSNAAKAYIYTPEEQAGMTPEGTIPTMITPSEIRERFMNAGKVTKPTGEVNYCDAGLSQLIQARRNAALAAIDDACGGKDQYKIRHEGPGGVKARYLGNVKLTPGCTRSTVIVFRCDGAQPKPDVSK